MASPKVSVVTIVRNDAEGFLATAKSILQQDYPNIEWIVVDGLSTDLTSHYVKMLSPQITKYKIEKDTGIYNAMNKGIDMASGEWLFFMNADDVFYSSDTISKYVMRLRDDDDFVHSDVERREDGLLHGYRPNHQHWLGMSQDHQTVCGRTGIYKNLRFDETYSIAGDFDFFSKARVMKYSFRKIPGIIGCLKPFDNGASVGYVARQKERIRVIKKYFGDLPYKTDLSTEYQRQCAQGNINKQECVQLLKLL